MSCHFHMVRKRMLAEKKATTEKNLVVEKPVETPVEKAAKPSKRRVKRGK